MHGAELRLAAGIGALATSVLGATPRSMSSDNGFLTVARGDIHGRPSDPAAAGFSADGRYVAFASYARLSEADRNDLRDIYVLDRQSGAVTLETAPPGYSQGDRSAPSVDAQGRFIVFEAVMTDLPALSVLVMRDRMSGLSRVLQRGGVQPDGHSSDGRISSAGALIAFTSTSTNLVEGSDANGHASDVYVAQLTAMTFQRVSVDDAGRQPGAGASFTPAISADGRFVAFSSTARFDDRSSPHAAVVNVYVRDLRRGVTTAVGVATDGGAPNGPCYQAAISADGRYVAFVSAATNLVRTSDDNRAPDVFLRDTVRNVTELISMNGAGGTGNGSSLHPAVSSDGRLVVFQSDASDLVCGARCPTPSRDINLVADIFARDRHTGTTRWVSRGRAAWKEPSLGPSIDGAGTVIAFSSRHPIDAHDDRDDFDLFMWIDPGAKSIDSGAHRRQVTHRDLFTRVGGWVVGQQ